MQTWTDTTYSLPADPHLLLCVTEHTESVSLHVPGYALDGLGFCVNFTAAQLPVVEELVQALRMLKDVETVRLMPPRKHTTHTDLDEEIKTRREREEAIP